MDKLRRALSGDDQLPYDEESNSIINQVCIHTSHIPRKYVLKSII